MAFRLCGLFEAFEGRTDPPSTDLTNAGILVGNACRDKRANPSFYDAKNINASRCPAPIQNWQRELSSLRHGNLIHFEHRLHQCLGIAADNPRDSRCAANRKSAQTAGLGDGTVTNVEVRIVSRVLREIVSIDDRRRRLSFPRGPARPAWRSTPRGSGRGGQGGMPRPDRPAP